MEKITRKCNRCNRIINTNESWYTFKGCKNDYMTDLSTDKEVLAIGKMEEKVLCRDCYAELEDWYRVMESESEKAFRCLLDEYYATPKHWESYKALKAAVDKLDKIEKIVKLPTDATMSIAIRYKYEAICKVLGIEG